MPNSTSKKQILLIFTLIFGSILVPFIVSSYFRQPDNSFLLFYIFDSVSRLPEAQEPPILDDFPFHFHAPWSNTNASITITMTWRTTETNESAIRYDTESKGGNPTQYSWENISQGQVFSSSYLHIIPLSNLQPNTIYYFICGSDEGGWSNEMKFKTPDSTPNEIIFIAGGDSRSQVDIRNNISDLMKNYSPEFVISSGDLVNDGRVQSLWDTWFDGMDSYWKTNDNYTIPIIPCLGNHEYNATNYYNQFALPHNEQWYSIDYSSLLNIICMSTNAQIDGAQLTWLKNDLKQYNDTLWKIVFFHEPPYCEGCHSSRTDVRETWGPIFDKFNVSIVFSGHCHLYERTKPIKNNTIADSYLNGTMYVTTGGWGAPPHSTNPQWWTSYSESNYHFCLINITTNINNSTLELKQIRLDNTIGDIVQIVKDL
ncbi:MAG: purple acid phosphatase family protein [Candidatus Helarchaeota archaeon]